MDAVEMYDELLTKLLRARQANGGALRRDVEDAVVGELSVYWHMMSEREKLERERNHATFTPSTARLRSTASG